MCESGGEGKVEEKFVRIHYEGIMNAMKLIGMMSGAPRLREKQIRLSSPALVSNKRAGLFNPFVGIGEKVKKGQSIGEILSFQGGVLETLRTPITGMVVDRINFAAADSFPTQKQPYLFYIAKTG
jgi:predicted deacylase